MALVVVKMAAPTNEQEADGQHILVCSESELLEKGRKLVEVHDRELIVYHVNGRIFALDSYCYHAGGPLKSGDIEDINGTLCVVCPWHKRRIALESGESLYKAIDPHNLDKPPKWTSKGAKQRTHHVTCQDGNIYVELSDLNSNQFESDYYYSEEHRRLMKNAGLKK